MEFTIKNYVRTPNTKMKFHCHCCQNQMPVVIHRLSKDNLNGDHIWADVTCCECHFVIATLTAPEEGEYDFVKIK